MAFTCTACTAWFTIVSSHNFQLRTWHLISQHNRFLSCHFFFLLWLLKKEFLKVRVFPFLKTPTPIPQHSSANFGFVRWSQLSFFPRSRWKKNHLNFKCNHTAVMTLLHIKTWTTKLNKGKKQRTHTHTFHFTINRVPL